MRGRVLAGLVLVGTVLMGAVASLAPVSAQSDENAKLSELGWWTRRPNPSVPEGGFEIAKEVDGPSSVAAVRIALGEGTVTSAMIVLKESGGLGQDGAAINACPTANGWSAAQGGDLSEAPKSDCAMKVALERDAEAGTWTADVTPLLADAEGNASVLFVPGESDSPLPVQPGFQVTFTEAQLIASNTSDSRSGSGSSPSGPTSSAGSGTVASGAPASSSGPATGVSDEYVASVVASAVSSPALVESVPPPAPEATAATPTAAAPADDTSTAVGDFEPVAAASSGSRQPWGRLLLLVPLSAAVGAAGALARRRGLAALFSR